MRLSVVATLYQSAAYVDDFHRRATAAARRVAGDSYEIVLVNDGSPDDSLQRAVDLTRRDGHVVVVDLSRNFGHHKAMMTGLAHARGEAVFLVDSDLEEEPEWLEAFWAAMHRQRCDVVYGVQRSRKGGWFERWSGQFYYRAMSAISAVKFPLNTVTARLMSRRYVDALLSHGEREIDIGGLWVITGFEQLPLWVSKHSTSETTYTFAHKVSVLANSVTSFSSLPLVAIFYMGAALFLAACAFAGSALLQWLFLSRPVGRLTTLLVSVWLLGALIILSVGIVGIYLSKVFSEVKRRPCTIVREVYGRDPV